MTSKSERELFDVGLMLDPQSRSDLVNLEEILESGLVKINTLGSSNLIGIEETLIASKKMRKHKRPMTATFWILERLAEESYRRRSNTVKIRLINWHVAEDGLIAYYTISDYWRKVAQEQLKGESKQ